MQKNMKKMMLKMIVNDFKCPWQTGRWWRVIMTRFRHMRAAELTHSLKNMLVFIEPDLYEN